MKSTQRPIGPPPPLHPPRPLRPPPPKLPPVLSNSSRERQKARQKPQPQKPHHKTPPVFGQYWNASLPQNGNKQPPNKSIMIQSPNWNSQPWVVPVPGAIIPRPDPKYTIDKV